MEPDAMKLAIATACGWKKYEGASLINYMWAPGHITRVVPKWYQGNPGDGLGFGPENPRMELPDYLNDLNAMREAEQMFVEERSDLLSVFIKNLCEETNSQLEWAFIRCDAFGHARAFLKTLDLYA